MKRTSRFFAATALVLAFLMLLPACTFRPVNPPETENTSSVPTQPPTTTQPVTVPPVTQPPVTEPPTQHSSEIVDPPVPVYPYTNPLTGEGTFVDLSAARPLAVVIANYYDKDTNATEAQANTSKADILIEYPVEGNYTRLLALYADYASVGEIGALRSARYYDIQLALGYEAIFASYGGSDLYKISDSLLKYGAYYYFNNGLVDALDFANDSKITKLKLTTRDVLKKLGASSTNGVTVSGEDFAAAIAKKGYATARSNTTPFMQFSDELVMLPDIGRTIRVNASSSRRVDFIYDGSTGLYARYQFSDDDGLLPHNDAVNGNAQLAFANVVVLFADVSPIAEDAKSAGNESALDRKYVKVVGSGYGYVATAGTSMQITWKKTSETSPIQFFDASGKEIKFNPGKICIEIIPSSLDESIIIQ